MPTEAEVLKAIAAQGIVPVLRAASPEDALFGAEAVIAAGFGVVEVTLTTPDALRVVKTLAQAGQAVGVGSIMDTTAAQAALDAGARFLVSPHLNESVFRLGREAGVLSVPGALTPTEVATALRWGASVIKIFPIASLGGVRYLVLLRDPFPQLRVIPTGGVTPAELGAYWRCGAIAVGVGASLVHPSWLRARDSDRLAQAITCWREALEAASVPSAQ